MGAGWSVRAGWERGLRLLVPCKGFAARRCWAGGTPKVAAVFARLQGIPGVRYSSSAPISPCPEAPWPISYLTNHHPTQDLLAFLADRRGQCGIIYARLRATCDWLAGQLGDADIDCAAYHAGKDPQQRAKVWREGERGRSFTSICILLLVAMNTRLHIWGHPPASLPACMPACLPACQPAGLCIQFLP